MSSTAPGFGEVATHAEKGMADVRGAGAAKKNGSEETSRKKKRRDPFEKDLEEAPTPVRCGFPAATPREKKKWMTSSTRS